MGQYYYYFLRSVQHSPVPTGCVYKSPRKHLEFNLNLQGHLVGVVQFWPVNNNLGGQWCTSLDSAHRQGLPPYWQFVWNYFQTVRLEPQGGFSSTQRGPTSYKFSLCENAFFGLKVLRRIQNFTLGYLENVALLPVFLGMHPWKEDKKH